MVNWYLRRIFLVIFTLLFVKAQCSKPMKCGNNNFIFFLTNSSVQFIFKEALQYNTHISNKLCVMFLHGYFKCYDVENNRLIISNKKFCLTMQSFFAKSGEVRHELMEIVWPFKTVKLNTWVTKWTITSSICNSVNLGQNLLRSFTQEYTGWLNMLL